MRPGYDETIAIESEDELQTAIAASLLQAEASAIDVIGLFTALESNNGQLALSGAEAKRTVWALTDLAEINSQRADVNTWRLDFIGRLMIVDKSLSSRRRMLGFSNGAFNMLTAYVKHPGFTDASACASHARATLQRLGQERKPIPRILVPKIVKI